MSAGGQPKRTPTITERQVASIPWEKITAAYKPLYGGQTPGSIHAPAGAMRSKPRSAGRAVAGREIDEVIAGIEHMRARDTVANGRRALSASLKTR